jgi:hypothetical protein
MTDPATAAAVATAAPGVAAYLPTWLAASLALGGVGAIVATVWGHAKTIWLRVSGVLVKRILLKGWTERTLEPWLWAKAKAQPTSLTEFYITAAFSYKEQKRIFYGKELISHTTRVYWKGWRPFLVHMDPGGPTTSSSVVICALRLPYIGLDLEKLFKEILEYGNDLQATTVGESRFYVEVIRGFGMFTEMKKKDEPGSPSSSSSGAAPSDENTVMPGRFIGADFSDFRDPDTGKAAMGRLWKNAEVEDAIKEAHRWLEAKLWYAEREIPWRRGWLLYGRPGTGKSSLTVALAKLMGIPLHRYDLGSMTNSEFQGAWKKSQSSSPCMVLFEDIDTVFEGRRNVHEDSGSGFSMALTFDAILNAIQGIEKAEGIFLIVTTNRLECIDEALRRPGRLDRLMELTIPSADGRLLIAKRILKGFSSEQVDGCVAAGEGESGAVFQERCASLALHAWNQGKENL